MPNAAHADPPTDIVDVSHANYHHLVFANADFAAFDNVYPAGSDTGYHRHARELFYVTIGAARASTQKFGMPLRSPPMAPVGAVGYNILTDQPFVHRVVNRDTRPYHVVAVEIRREKPLGATTSDRTVASGYVEIFDNARMRAWRLILAPGQSVSTITQSNEGLRIVVRGGTLVTSESGYPDQTLALSSGDLALQSRGATRALRNIGTKPIELVELELK